LIKKYLKLILSGIIFLPVHSAYAICPICTAAVGAGVLFTRNFGIDDMITGSWVGGLLVSSALWTDEWLRKKKVEIRYQGILLVAGYFLVIILPLYFKGLIGHPLNKICGFDKLMVGVVFGALAFQLGCEINVKLKERNGGKVYFPFQKVVLAIAPLVILSGVFYWLSKC
jgi:hypothetical protein